MPTLDVDSALASSAWLPLESNPEIFNAFGKRIGLPDDWGFVDVLGLDDELLDMVPEPCAALILLFPCEPEIMARRRAAASAHDPVTTDDIYFLAQHAAAGNACGTFAAIHAISNSQHAFELRRGTPLDQLLSMGHGMSADERGRVLLTMSDLRERSDAAAEDAAAQTACPRRDGPDLEHHFVAFVCSSKGRLVELDGTKAHPIDHGEVSLRTFKRRAAAVVRELFLPRDGGGTGASIEFALCALCRLARRAEGEQGA
ncbi:hypothetical protein KFE25_011841 [Diacronema lutheri]|uniref:Ubiquitin carboxyl-terminal hydrolase n=2 Tax=Diacronema lutheri TaxID=2081491 RepID=A0A8J5XBZ3_DIALT|nr:hypothetical protein KFE25_011841 [Diacronema lutheri]